MATPEYQSSEELQRHNSADVFARAEKDKEETRSEKEKLKAVLDTHIAKHSSTKTVRDIAKEHGRTAEYQLDLSADIVELLEKIKSDLR